MQICRELTWEDYLNRLRIADTCNAKAKIVKAGGTVKIIDEAAEAAETKE